MRITPGRVIPNASSGLEVDHHSIAATFTYHHCRLAAERQKICSPWRKPWDWPETHRPSPGGATEIIRCFSIAALRLVFSPGVLPTADAVGYRFFCRSAAEVDAVE